MWLLYTYTYFNMYQCPMYFNVNSFSLNMYFNIFFSIKHEITLPIEHEHYLWNSSFVTIGAPTSTERNASLESMYSETPLNRTPSELAIMFGFNEVIYIGQK